MIFFIGFSWLFWNTNTLFGTTTKKGVTDDGRQETRKALILLVFLDVFLNGKLKLSDDFGVANEKKIVYNTICKQKKRTVAAVLWISANASDTVLCKIIILDFYIKININLIFRNDVTPRTCKKLKGVIFLWLKE